MKLVHLWEFESDFLGFIYPCKSGIVWSNQVGGISCGHPEIEGVYVPLPSPKFKDDPLVDYYMSRHSSEYNYKGLITQFLDVYHLSEWFSPLSDWNDVPGIQQLVAEAWIPVRVKPIVQYSNFATVLRPFTGEAVILTYPNSD